MVRFADFGRRGDRRAQPHLLLHGHIQRHPRKDFAEHWLQQTESSPPPHTPLSCGPKGPRTLPGSSLLGTELSPAEPLSVVTETS